MTSRTTLVIIGALLTSSGLADPVDAPPVGDVSHQLAHLEWVARARARQERSLVDWRPPVTLTAVARQAWLLHRACCEEKARVLSLLPIATSEEEKEELYRIVAETDTALQGELYRLKKQHLIPGLPEVKSP